MIQAKVYRKKTLLVVLWRETEEEAIAAAHKYDIVFGEVKIVLEKHYD